MALDYLLSTVVIKTSSNLLPAHILLLYKHCLRLVYIIKHTPYVIIRKKFPIVYYSRLSILRTPDIANISILRTETHFPSFYSNKSLINHLYITNLRYSELSVLRTKFSFPPTKTPRYNELKALNATESKSTR